MRFQYQTQKGWVIEDIQDAPLALYLDSMTT